MAAEKSGADGLKSLSDPLKRAYGMGEVSRLTGISRITLHVWDRTGFLRPGLYSGGRGTGNRRKYAFVDIVALRVVKKLRDQGVSLAALKKIARYLNPGSPGVQTLKSACLAVSGSDVVMKEGEEVFSVLKKPGQYTLLFPLDMATEKATLLEEIKKAAA